MEKREGEEEKEGGGGDGRRRRRREGWRRREGRMDGMIRSRVIVNNG